MVMLDTFGKRLKAARERARLTQDELADRMRKHRFTVAKWEQGLHPPKVGRDYDEAAYQVGCSVVWLRDGVGDMGSAYVPDPEAPDAVARRAVRRVPRQRPLGVLDHAAEAPAAYHHHPGDARGVDWLVVAGCVRILIEVKPDLPATDLARALPVLYAVAGRSPEACDAAMAAQVLQAMQ